MALKVLVKASRVPHKFLRPLWSPESACRGPAMLNRGPESVAEAMKWL